MDKNTQSGLGYIYITLNLVLLLMLLLLLLLMLLLLWSLFWFPDELFKRFVLCFTFAKYFFLFIFCL